MRPRHQTQGNARERGRGEKKKQAQVQAQAHAELAAPSLTLFSSLSASSRHSLGTIGGEFPKSKSPSFTIPRYALCASSMCERPSKISCHAGVPFLPLIHAEPLRSMCSLRFLLLLWHHHYRVTHAKIGRLACPSWLSEPLYTMPCYQ